MFLSIIELNPRCRQVQSELRDLYEMHRTISKAFDDEGYDKARCLFRIDGSDRPKVLIQSLVRPCWDRLTTPTDYTDSEPKIVEFEPVIQCGQLLHFKLRVNPTVKRDGKREGLYREEEQYAWLKRKGEQGGFGVLDVVARSEGEQKANRDKIVSLAVVFEGTLRVTDAEVFIETLKSGIGSAKGFGFGLLSLARA